MWILIASSLVPLPLAQGWVMFVSVFCFVATTSLMILYIIGTHGGETSWITLVSAGPGNLYMGRGVSAGTPSLEDYFPKPELWLPWKHFSAQSKVELAWP